MSEKEPKLAIKECSICKVPLHLHSTTACGWINAHHIVNPKNEQERIWQKLKQESHPLGGIIVSLIEQQQADPFPAYKIQEMINEIEELKNQLKDTKQELFVANSIIDTLKATANRKNAEKELAEAEQK